MEDIEVNNGTEREQWLYFQLSCYQVRFIAGILLLRIFKNKLTHIYAHTTREAEWEDGKKAFLD